MSTRWMLYRSDGLRRLVTPFDDWRVYGHDVGWNAPNVVLELGKTAFDQLVVVDAFYETENHTADVIDWLKDCPADDLL